MGSGVAQRDDGVLWDITCPKQLSRVPGITMAGFRDRGTAKTLPESRLTVATPTSPTYTGTLWRSPV